MNKQNVSDILDLLASKFGTTAAHLWEVLIRQVYIEAAASCALAIALTIPAIIMARKCYRWWTVIEERKDGSRATTWADRNDGLAITGSIITAILAAFAIICIIGAIMDLTQLANPEYGALKLIGKALNPSK